eukprot:GHVR01084955.1.p1 GENE.GHVR01084955.1~~GHVR01084955.1.p1  ORF type:complete len:141 (-),score=15.52 GHVR01084955.1:163-585(-)
MFFRLCFSIVLLGNVTGNYVPNVYEYIASQLSFPIILKPIMGYNTFQMTVDNNHKRTCVFSNRTPHIIVLNPNISESSSLSDLLINSDNSHNDDDSQIIDYLIAKDGGCQPVLTAENDVGVCVCGCVYGPEMVIMYKDHR